MVPQIKKCTSTYVFGDFAEDVHNDAEKACIKAGYVTKNFTWLGYVCNASRHME
jgi:hypothetical protein